MRVRTRYLAAEYQLRLDPQRFDDDPSRERFEELQNRYLPHPPFFIQKNDISAMPQQQVEK